jgi:hypothetical protein
MASENLHLVTNKQRTTVHDPKKTLYMRDILSHYAGVDNREESDIMTLQIKNESMLEPTFAAVMMRNPVKRTTEM